MMLKKSLKISLHLAKNRWKMWLSNSLLRFTSWKKKQIEIEVDIEIDDNFGNEIFWSFLSKKTQELN